MRPEKLTSFTPFYTRQNEVENEVVFRKGLTTTTQRIHERKMVNYCRKDTQSAQRILYY